MEHERKVINNADDVHLLVDTFYSRTSKDELLAPNFKGRMSDLHHDPLY